MFIMLPSIRPRDLYRFHVTPSRGKKSKLSSYSADMMQSMIIFRRTHVSYSERKSQF
jgi:hypothetical protein